VGKSPGSTVFHSFSEAGFEARNFAELQQESLRQQMLQREAELAELKQQQEIKKNEFQFLRSMFAAEEKPREVKRTEKKETNEFSFFNSLANKGAIPKRTGKSPGFSFFPPPTEEQHARQSSYVGHLPNLLPKKDPHKMTEEWVEKSEPKVSTPNNPAQATFGAYFPPGVRAPETSKPQVVKQPVYQNPFAAPGTPYNGQVKMDPVENLVPQFTEAVKLSDPRQSEDDAVYLALPTPWNKIPTEPAGKDGSFLRLTSYSKEPYAGDLDGYFSWRNEFITGMHSKKTSFALKCQAMYKTLDSKAPDTKTIYRNLQANPTASGYTNAIHALEDLFGGPNRLVEVKRRAIDRFPGLTINSHREFRQFLAAVEEYREVLKQHDKLYEFNTTELFNHVESFLDTHLRQLYYSHCALFDKQLDRPENLYQWMKQQSAFMTRSAQVLERQALETATKAPAKSKETKSKETKVEVPLTNRFKAFQQEEVSSDESEPEEQSYISIEEELAFQANEEFALVTQEKETPMCPLCKIRHLLLRCPKFKAMTNAQRREMLLQKKRCILCFGEHFVANCTSKRIKCHICKRRHHTQVHLSDSDFSKKPAITNVHLDDEDDMIPGQQQ
jgi:hypothetical protein